MKTRQARISLRWLQAIAIGALAGLAPALRAQQAGGGNGCSVASLNGSYGYYRSGQGSFGGPLAAVGVFLFDGAGNASAVQNISRDGALDLDSPFTATYTIASNCSGSAFSADGTEFARFVVIDDGKGFYLFSESEGSTIFGVGTRIHAPRDGASR